MSPFWNVKGQLISDPTVNCPGRSTPMFQSAPKSCPRSAPSGRLSSITGGRESGGGESRKKAAP